MEAKDKLLEAIRNKKQELNNVIAESNNLHSEEIIRISQELDVLIVKAMAYQLS